MIVVTGFARGHDGTIAACGAAADKEGRSASYVGWISADGKNVKVVRMDRTIDRYIPFLVTVASDGTIWTAGAEEIRPGAVPPSTPMFRQFDRTGKMIRAFVPQSELRHPGSLRYQAKINWPVSRAPSFSVGSCLRGRCRGIMTDLELKNQRSVTDGADTRSSTLRGSMAFL